jgi:hypothetical protein
MSTSNDLYKEADKALEELINLRDYSDGLRDYHWVVALALKAILNILLELLARS